MKRHASTAVLLAAGRGQRLRPHTDYTPKPLLMVDGRPMLDYVLSAVRLAGITNAVVVTHHQAEQVEAYVGDGSAWGLRAVCCHQPYLGGTAHGLQIAFSAWPTLFDRQQPFLLTATDYALAPGSLAELVAFHAANHADMTISLKRMPLAEIVGRSSVLLGPDGDLIQIIEKPTLDEISSPLVASLVVVLPGIAQEYLADTPPSSRGEVEIQSVINRMLHEGFTANLLEQAPPREYEVLVE